LLNGVWKKWQYTISKPKAETIVARYCYFRAESKASLSKFARGQKGVATSCLLFTLINFGILDVAYDIFKTDLS
jgi:hypothetical protein